MQWLLSIGETGRLTEVWLKEYIGVFKNGKINSRLVQHAFDMCHRPSFTNLLVLKITLDYYHYKLFMKKGSLSYTHKCALNESGSILMNISCFLINHFDKTRSVLYVPFVLMSVLMRLYDDMTKFLWLCCTLFVELQAVIRWCKFHRAISLLYIDEIVMSGLCN